MTASELIATLSRLPAETEVVLDVGIETFLDVQAFVDEAGVRLAPAADGEGAAFTDAVRTLFEARP